MGKQKKFRSTLGGGYKKQDVNEYIESMQAEWNGIEETLKNTINRQKEELDALRAETNDAALLRAALDEATAAKDEADTVCDDLRSRIAALDDENTALTAKLEALRTANALTEAEASAQGAEEAPFELDASAEEVPIFAGDASDGYAELKFKAEQYDRMSASVGAIMLKANANAEEILSRARKDAEALLSGVNSELIATRAKAQSTAETLVNDIGVSMSRVNASACEEIMGDIAELRASLSTVTEEIVKKSAEIDRKLYASKDRMLTAAERVIRDATAQRVLKK